VVALAIPCSSLMHSAEKGVYVDGVLGEHNSSYHNYYRVDGKTSPFASFWFAVWWCVQTLTSAGYGDDYPITDAGKVVATLTAVFGMFLLALPITIIGANFDEEYALSQRGADLDKKSRVVKYNTLTRNGTRPLEPSLRSRLLSRRKVAPFSPLKASTPSGATEAPSSFSRKFDSHFEDQAYNVQADISMLLDTHFEAMRVKFNGVLRRNTENLNRWVTTDLRYIDAESKTATQVTSSAVSRLKAVAKLGGKRRELLWPSPVACPHEEENSQR